MPTAKLPTVNNNAILNHILAVAKLKNDAALARLLDVAPPVISKIRAQKLPFGPTLIIKAHEMTGMPVAEIKSVLCSG